MGRTNGGGGGSSLPSDDNRRFMEFAERNARQAGRLADLKIGSSELFLQTTEQTRMALCISDPNKPDCPIVYCNQAFVELTGYSREEIVGQNCRFLQGKNTAPEAVAKLAHAVKTEEYTVVDILNYRKDGTAFWNAVHVGPIYHEDGSLAYFFGSQWDITELLVARETIIENERVAKELRHRTDNLFAVLTAIVRLSSQGATDVREFSEKIERRIEALAGAHRVSLAGDGLREGKSNLRDLVEAVLRPYRNAKTDRIEIEGGSIDLSRRQVTPVGLTLHELATNALKYGALSSGSGRVHVDWRVDDEWLEIHWIEQLGEESQPLSSTPPVRGSGSGSFLIDGVIRGVKGSFSSHYRPEGLSATIRVPLAVKTLT
ncbi:PAS domain-containing protein [Qipengyuania aquimaris]|uniref:PAS domain-containing protein n=1 Tax=Qipengyuania aquimaris TaxID=255984 RepID=UPI001FCFC6EB|nr:PAS domain-containing protein [Qipengyuania aquimaris]UOR15313.1 PAS domain-containing protein [Qipengyuania aquimaris]